MAAKKKITTKASRSHRKTTKVVHEKPQQAVQKLRSGIQASPTTILLLVIIIGLSFFSGYFYFQAQNLAKDTPQPGGPAQPQQPREIEVAKPTTQEPWRGSKDARYVWIEYSDLECPFCQSIHPDLQRILNEYDGQVAWVFRHYPLNSIHPKAQKAAEAAECAADQGGNDAFWQMVDAIYDRMPDIEKSEFSTLAGEIGLNSGALQQCLDSNKFEEKVQNATATAGKDGIQATPTGIIYDLKTGESTSVEGAAPYEQLKQSLDSFIEKTS